MFHAAKFVKLKFDYWINVLKVFHVTKSDKLNVDNWINAFEELHAAKSVKTKFYLLNKFVWCVARSQVSQTTFW